MKHLFFICLLIFSVTPSSAAPTFNAPNLGKTHFIVGLPPEKIAPPRQPTPQQSTLLGDRLVCHDGCYKQAFFSPDDDLQDLLVQLINHEQSSIRIAVFSFTDGRIAQALIDAKRRGALVEIITDVGGKRDKFSKIDLLVKNGIAVMVYDPRNTTIYNDIMHNKFVLFGNNIGGKSLLWTGSYNFTKSATMNNQENVIVCDERHLIEKFAQQFERLKERVSKKKRFITTIPS